MLGIIAGNKLYSRVTSKSGANLVVYINMRPFKIMPV